MDLGQYVNDLQRQLLDSAENGTDDTRAVAERLVAGLDSAARLVLLDVLSAAAGEITRDLAPGSVDLRLRGREVEFVVTQAEHRARQRRRARHLGRPRRREHLAHDAPPARRPQGEGRRGGGRRTACPSTRGWSGRSPPHSSPSNDDPRSARCAPATASPAGPANPPSPPAPPATRTRGAGRTHPEEGRRQHAHVHHAHPDRPRHPPAGRRDRGRRRRPHRHGRDRHADQPGEGGRPPGRGGDHGRLRRPAAHDHRPEAALQLHRPERVGRRRASSCPPARGSPPRARWAASARSGASAPPGSSARWDRSTSSPPATCGCAPGTATRPSAPRTARPRSPPTTGRSGSARSPATRSSRRRTGRVQIGESGGDLDAKLSYGDLEIAQALGSVTAKTAYGSIPLHEVSSGSIQVESGYGQVTVGVRDRASPPGSTCPRRAGTSATSSRATAPPPSPSSPSPSAPAPRPGNITVQRAR